MWSRETRLLMLTIGLSAGVLLVLAQFRFPEERRVEPPPQPLERLAARATYDELASIVERLDRRLAPSIVVLQLGTRQPREPRALEHLLAAGPAGGAPPMFVPALRVRSDIVITYLDAFSTVQGVLGDDEALPIVLATDALRRIAVVRVPRAADDLSWRWQGASALTVPRYVVSVEGSRGGSTLRPIFLSRADRFEGLRWEAPLLVLGHATVAEEGSFIFSLEGELVGMVVSEGGVLGVAPAPALTAAADELLEHGSRHITDFGLALQALDATLARHYETTRGVVVAGVAPGALVEDRILPGDLIERVGGRPASNPEALLVHLAQAMPGETVVFTVRRDDRTVDVPVEVPQ